MEVLIQTTQCLQCILLQPSEPPGPAAKFSNVFQADYPHHHQSSPQGVGLGQEWSHSLGDKEIFLSL